MGQMHFGSYRGSYREEMLRVTVGLVNALTAGTDGLDPVDVPADAAGRRDRVHGIEPLAGRDLDPGDLAGFVRLAGELRGVFERCDAGDVDGAAAEVNRLLADYRSAPQLIRHDDQPWHLHFHSADAGVVVGWAAGCATGLAVVIGSGEADRLGVCTAEPCDRVFIDASRNGNRRFCSTRCSNRVMAAAHRARRRST